MQTAWCILHLVVACVADAAVGGFSLLSLHKRALWHEQSGAQTAPTLAQHEFVLLWLQTSLLIACLLVEGISLSVAPRVKQFRFRLGAEPFVWRLACTLATVLGNAYLRWRGSVSLLTATVLVLVVAAVHLQAVLLLGILVKSLGDRGSVTGATQVLRRTLLTFAVSVDYGLCVIKTVAAACTALQLRLQPCGREFAFVLSVAGCAATLLVGSHIGWWHKPPSGAVRSHFGQFSVIPLVVALCSVDATSSVSPQVVVFCGIVSSFVVVSAGSIYAVAQEEDGSGTTDSGGGGGSGSGVVVGLGARVSVGYRRALHSKAI